MPEPFDGNQLSGALTALGLPDSPDMRQQLWGFAMALEIYAEREPVHHGLWKTTGLVDCTHNAAHKVARLRAWAERGGQEADDYSPMPADSALDGMNYLAFAFRHITDAID